MKEMMTLRSGAKIPQISAQEAERRNYLTRNVLAKMHLMTSGDPVAFDRTEDGSITYYFDPTRVAEAPPEPVIPAPIPAPNFLCINFSNLKVILSHRM